MLRRDCWYIAGAISLTIAPQKMFLMKSCYPILFGLVTALCSPFTSASEIGYLVSGQLDDGSMFSGTFQVSANAEDFEEIEGRGDFRDFAEFNLSLTETELFLSDIDSSTSGSAIQGRILQAEDIQDQQLWLLFLSDSGHSLALLVLQFDRFLGDADVFSSLNVDDFRSGYGTGNFTSFLSVTSLTLTAIPEPTGALFLCSTGALTGMFRRRRTA